MTKLELLQLAANSYFWVFIVISGLTLLGVIFSDDDHHKKIKGSIFYGIIAWTLFVMSCHLK